MGRKEKKGRGRKYVTMEGEGRKETGGKGKRKMTM